jgi:hypothetical protein
MLQAEGRRVDQGIGTRVQRPSQFTGFFAVNNHALDAALDKFAWQGRRQCGKR